MISFGSFNSPQGTAISLTLVIKCTCFGLQPASMHMHHPVFHPLVLLLAVYSH